MKNILLLLDTILGLGCLVGLSASADGFDSTANVTFRLKHYTCSLSNQTPVEAHYVWYNHADFYTNDLGLLPTPNNQMTLRRMRCIIR